MAPSTKVLPACGFGRASSQADDLQDVKGLKIIVKNTFIDVLEEGFAELDDGLGRAQTAPPLLGKRLEVDTSSDDEGEADEDLDEKDLDEIAMKLDSAHEGTRHLTIDRVLNSFQSLAATQKGCRIVQKAFDRGTLEERQQLTGKLHGRVLESYKSPHANHILQKCIEVMPSHQIQFVLTELQGEVCSAARHRFGRRILQRLIEQCPLWQTEPLINEVLNDMAALCRNQYGNFVIQHILKHGSMEQRNAIADMICGDAISLEKHRHARHVVSCAMEHFKLSSCCHHQLSSAGVAISVPVLLSDARSMSAIAESFTVRASAAHMEHFHM